LTVRFVPVTLPAGRDHSSHHEDDGECVQHF